MLVMMEKERGFGGIFIVEVDRPRLRHTQAAMYYPQRIRPFYPSRRTVYSLSPTLDEFGTSFPFIEEAKLCEADLSIIMWIEKIRYIRYRSRYITKE